jgi:hypothetical protein
VERGGAVQCLDRPAQLELLRLMVPTDAAAKMVAALPPTLALDMLQTLPLLAAQRLLVALDAAATKKLLAFATPQQAAALLEVQCLSICPACPDALRMPA